MTVMEIDPDESRSTRNSADSSQLTEAAAIGLLLSRDLIFTTKVNQTAAALGYRVLSAGDTSLARSLIETVRPRVVFVDLTAGELVSPSSLSSFLVLAGRDASFIAFGPHVEADTLAAARSAGCHLVLTRSRFVAELPALIRQYFAGQPADPG